MTEETWSIIFLAYIFKSYMTCGSYIVVIFLYEKMTKWYGVVFMLMTTELEAWSYGWQDLKFQIRNYVKTLLTPIAIESGGSCTAIHWLWQI